MKPYVEGSEEVAVNFISSVNKTISNYRDVDDGCARHLSAKDSSESTAGTSKSSANHSQIIEHSSSNAYNVNEFGSNYMRASARI